MKAAIAPILAAVAAIAWIWIDWVPSLAPEGAASGSVAEVFAEAVRTGSTDRLLQHARSVPDTKVCIALDWFRWAVRSSGASAAGVPNYKLEENRWAFILVRPEGPAEFVTVWSAQVSPWGTDIVECLRAEDADIALSGPYLGGTPGTRLTVAPLRR